MYVADNGTLQVKPTYIFWCVTDFSVCPHGQMLGIVLWQLLIGVQLHSRNGAEANSMPSCRRYNHFDTTNKQFFFLYIYV